MQDKKVLRKWSIDDLKLFYFSILYLFVNLKLEELAQESLPSTNSASTRWKKSMTIFPPRYQ